jgi:putative DNA primase/helicase
MTHLRTDDIHRTVDWPTLLPRLGIDVALKKRNRPCPACGGKDRFTFDNRKGCGDFFCRHCGAGTGFDLLMRVHGWTFTKARQEVIKAAGLAASGAAQAHRISPPITHDDGPATPSKRQRSIVASSCAVIDCPDAVAYLTSRGLWPLAHGTALRGHVGIDYFDDDGQKIGKFAALVAPLTNINGELVTLHVTYLDNGQKLARDEPRKLLGKHNGQTGCAVRLMPAGETLGITEGIETAISAAIIDNVPVWAALNANLLSKFEPPKGVTTLRIYADRDVTGLLATCRLMERLQGRVRLEVQVPKASHKDFNDQLTATLTTRRLP